MKNYYNVKKLNPNFNFGLIIILVSILFISSCSSLFYSKKRSPNNTFKIESNISNFKVVFPLQEKSGNEYFSGLRSNGNSIDIELPKLNKKYLNFQIVHPDYDTQSFKIKKNLRGSALLMDVGLSIFTFGIPLIVDPFKSDFYKISLDSKRIYVEMKYSQTFLNDEYFKIRNGKKINDFQKYIQKYPESKWKQDAFTKIDSLEYTLAISNLNIKEISEFLNTRPTSKYKPDAENKIDSLQLSVEISKFNINGINQFISTHPNSKFITNASNALKEIQEINSAYEDAKKQNTLSVFRQFIKNYPTSIYVPDAKKAIENLIEVGVITIKEGVTYKGEFKTRINGEQVKQGKGLLTLTDGTKYDGIWDENNFKTGSFFNNKGDKIYDGEWKEGKFSGKGKAYPNEGELAGYTLDGNFLNGKANGFGISYKSDGTKEYEGEWKDFKYDGKGILYLFGKKSYEGGWQKGLMNGYGVIYEPNGQKDSEGYFKDAKLNGLGKKYVNGKMKYEGEFADGEPNGTGIAYDDNGKKIYEGSMVRGVAYGNGISYKKNGMKEHEGIFVEGKYSPSDEHQNDNTRNVDYNNDARLKTAKGHGTLAELMKCSSYKSFQSWIYGWEASFVRELKSAMSLKNSENRGNRALAILEKYGTCTVYSFDGYSGSGPTFTWVRDIARKKDLSESDVKNLVDEFNAAYERGGKVYQSVINMN